MTDLRAPWRIPGRRFGQCVETNCSRRARSSARRRCVVRPFPT